MSELPDPNPDGTCLDCSKPAETNDGRFCAKCLRQRIKDENPYVKPAISEQRGRPSRHSGTLGGAPEVPDGG